MRLRLRAARGPSALALGELTVPPSLLCLPAKLAIAPHFFFRCGIAEAIIIAVVFAFYENTDARVSSPVLLPPVQAII